MGWNITLRIKKKRIEDGTECSIILVKAEREEDGMEFNTEDKKRKDRRRD